MSAYLNDLIILGRTMQQCLRAVSEVTSLLHSLGFQINQAKSSLEPSRCLEHLGFRLDSKAMTMTLPKAKVRNLRREASKLVG